MPLVDRQRVRTSVDLTRAGEHHAHAGVLRPARLENRQLRAAVDVEIGIRIPHAVDVADLAGEIEDDVLILDEHVHRVSVAQIGDVHANPILEAADVEVVAAVVGEQRVDQQNVGAKRGKLVGQVAADESEAARDHHAPAAVEIPIGHRYPRSSGPAWPTAAPAGTSAGCAMCSRLITSAYQSLKTSTPVLNSRRKLKNCERP